MIRSPKYKFVALAAAFSVLLGGCGSEEGDLKAELQALTVSVPVKIPALAPAAAFEVTPYAGAKQRDPFAPTGSGAAGGVVGGKPAPDLARTKEQLEAFPLDSIRMVGSLQRQGKMTAIVSVGNVLYQVVPGSYMGMDFGRVTRVSAGSIEIKETVQDANNIWVDRMSSIQLEETEGRK